MINSNGCNYPCPEQISTVQKMLEPFTVNVLKFWTKLNNFSSCCLKFLKLCFAKKFTVQNFRKDLLTAKIDLAIGRFRSHEKNKQAAHGPRFAHLSDIVTADMQILCNIFQILSSQLMKISSFEQFLVLKKNIWA